MSSPDADGHMLSRRDVFLLVLDELDAVGAGVGALQALRGAALLRQLLLDSPRLVDVVNRQPRVRLRYVINPNEPTAAGSGQAWIAGDGLDPETSHPYRRREVELRLDGLLATPVYSCDGQHVTVAELIRHFAHVEGGVHVGAPTDDTSRRVHELLSESHYIVGGGPDRLNGAREIRALARIVRRALEPLRAVTLADIRGHADI